MTDGSVERGHKFPDEDVDVVPARKKRILAAAACRDDVEHEDRLDAFDELANLLQIGIPPTQAVDAYAVDVLGLSPEDWARFREATPQAISMNINKARTAVLEEMGRAAPDTSPD